jgi:hypothetical protein
VCAMLVLLESQPYVALCLILQLNVVILKIKYTEFVNSKITVYK